MKRAFVDLSKRVVFRDKEVATLEHSVCRMPPRNGRLFSGAFSVSRFNYLRQALGEIRFAHDLPRNPNVAVVFLVRPLTIKVRVSEQGADAKQNHAANPDETCCRQIG